ncbi:hypothetical protein QTP88_005265 [Uroleucon formosanum]
MWCFRRMLKISWTDMVSNEEVLKRMSVRRTLWSNIKKRRNEWIGHAPDLDSSSSRGLDSCDINNSSFFSVKIFFIFLYFLTPLSLSLDERSDVT